MFFCFKRKWNNTNSFVIDSNQASALSYDETNTYSTGAYKKPIIYTTTYIVRSGKTIGYVQLRGSAGCHTAWAFLKFYSPAPKNNYVNAYIERYKNGYQLTCNSSGGNKAVQKG